MEYEEIIALKYHPEIAKEVLRTLLKLPNIHKQFIYYRWHLINADPDDNKFIDCAVSANAHYLVSHDKHLDVLKNVTFPKLVVLRLDEFKPILSPWISQIEIKSYPLNSFKFVELE